MKVRLIESEIQQGIDVGRKRQYWALKRGYHEQHGFDGVDGLEKHIEGACGEVGVAKLLGLPWPATVNTFGQGSDIGSLIQVRTRSKLDYELLIRPKDLEQHAQHYFVLAVGHRPDYTMVGWIKAIDAQRPEWLKDYDGRPPAWFVPHKELCRDFLLLCELGA